MQVKSNKSLYFFVIYLFFRNFASVFLYLQSRFCIVYIEGSVEDIGMDIFNRGLCLPSDNKMTPDEQDRIIEVIKACFE